MRKLLVVFLFCAASVAAQVEPKTGRTNIAKLSGTTAPPTCTTGEFFIKTDNPLGQRVGTCNNGAWEFPNAPGGAVASVFGRTGAVVKQANDYDWTDIANKPSTFAPSSHGHVKADISDFGTYESPLTFNTGLSRSVNTVTCATASGTIFGCLASADFNTFNSKQAALGFTPENSANRNAANGYAGLSGGLLASAQLPFPSLTTLGGVKSKACTGSDKVSEIGTDGVPVCSADQQGSGTFPVGGIILMLASCPSGFAEETTLSGKFVLGTLNASGDVTTTGGADTITEVINHTHPQNAPSSASGGALRLAVDTNASGSVAAGLNTDNPAGGVASVDNRPAFVKVIFCKKT